MNRKLTVLLIDGLRLENLGNYLAGLGLLAAVARKWPEMRACWRRGRFLLLGEGLDAKTLATYLLNEWQPSPYERWWDKAQKADTKAKSDATIAALRAAETDLDRVRLLDSQIVPIGRNQFNPVVGTGGNIGKRSLSKLRDDSWRLLEESAHSSKAAWLDHTLFGSPATLPPLNSAGSWFVYANKTFNSGQSWYREGSISPWAVLLSIEGARLLQGGSSRRLGATSRPYAVFPFISNAPSPVSAGEIGLVRSEFWAPVWRMPASQSELRAMLGRGLAKVGGRTAASPHEFAVAALAAGVDSGIDEFIRFQLRQTTSSQVYEAIPCATVPVAEHDSTEAYLLQPLLPWLDSLPREPRDSKQRGKFAGLRGPIEESIIAVAARPAVPESWRRLLLTLAAVQFRIDRNKALRDKIRAIPLLDPRWAERAWPNPPPEILFARAVASIGARTPERLQVNVFGVEFGIAASAVFARNRSQRVVWQENRPEEALFAVLERRLRDSEPAGELPLSATLACPGDVIEQALLGAVDLNEAARWIPPLSLLDWVGAGVLPSPASKQPGGGDFLALAFLKPLFHPRNIQMEANKFWDKPPHVAPARKTLALLRGGQLRQAFEFAASRYRIAGHVPVLPPAATSIDPLRLSALLLLPQTSFAVANGISRWLEPSKRN